MWNFQLRKQERVVLGMAPLSGAGIAPTCDILSAQPRQLIREEIILSSSTRWQRRRCVCCCFSSSGKMMVMKMRLSQHGPGLQGPYAGVRLAKHIPPPPLGPESRVSVQGLPESRWLPSLMLIMSVSPRLGPAALDP